MFNNDRKPGQRFQGNWQCSKCGNQITELPFDPDPSRLDTLKCFDCMKSARGDRGDRGGGRGGFSSGQQFQGNWQCSKCGAQITSLPFEPDPSRLAALKCSDCHRESRRRY